MHRKFLLAALFFSCTTSVAQDGQLRPARTDEELKSWLQNMAWHQFTPQEMQQVTGLVQTEITRKLTEFGIRTELPDLKAHGKLFTLPYPGGRHPRIGFLDGAVEPQRETKLSVFCPWDSGSYAVLDFPEAIWSNLGLTYLAHTHVETIWTKQGISLAQMEWSVDDKGHFTIARTLPNGIAFGVKAIPLSDHVRLKMWLTNGTDKPLSDLRVQNCVMLKAMNGFEDLTNDNKKFQQGYAVAHSADRNRWVISAWDPLHKAWGNASCPCLHSDPKFEDCQPGETKWLRGRFSFYEGTDIESELSRIEGTQWRSHPLHHVTGNLVGRVTDARTKKILPCRLYVQETSTGAWHFARSTAVAGSAVVCNKQIGKTSSVEKHTTLSADGFQLDLKPGTYRVTAVYGKEYLPAETTVEITDAAERLNVSLKLKRFANMPKLGWYSGDTHVHRPVEEIRNLIVAEDVNVAFPMTYWVRDSTEIPASTAPAMTAEPEAVDETHLIYPINTEYEIFSVNRKRHTQGAVLVLNHRTPLDKPAPPVLSIAEEARRQGAILDLDKHSWNWSMMIIPLMKVDLFELSNNHHWRTSFGFPKWTLENAPDWPEIERDEQGFTDLGWTEFGLQTYYSVLNCGFRMRVTAGTASGVHPVALGHGRVYVHCGEKFSYDNWISNLNQGHSFVTQGPLLDVRFNGSLPGTTWTKLSVRNDVKVEGEIRSLNPLRRIEVITNGVVVAVVDPQSESVADGSYRFTVDQSVAVKGTSWVALRCFEDLPDGKVVFAHTNPVFIDVADHPLRPRKDRVAFFVHRMDEEIKRSEGILSDEALAEYRQARSIYAELLRTAR